MKKATLFIAFVIVSNVLFSQANDIVIAFGKFKIEWGNLDNAKITLYENDVQIDTYRPDGSGKFQFELKLNKEYMFWFQKRDYVTKKVYFNTNVPEQVTSDPDFEPFPDFDFYVTLFKSYPEVDTMFFVNPVGKIGYSPKINDFDWDKDYTLRIIKQMEQIEEDIKRRHEEAEELKKQKEKDDKRREKELLAQKEEEERQRKNDLEARQKEEEKKRQDEESEAKKKQKDEEAELLENLPEIENNTNPVAKTETNAEIKQDQPLVTHSPTEPKKDKNITNSQEIPVDKVTSLKPINDQPKMAPVEKTEIAGKTITKTPVKQGNTTLIYVKVEYTWGGRFFFIQDEENVYRNISEIYYKRMVANN